MPKPDVKQANQLRRSIVSGLTSYLGEVDEHGTETEAAKNWRTFLKEQIAELDGVPVTDIFSKP